jgi:membrane-associated phospholipid phosphatase
MWKEELVLYDWVIYVYVAILGLIALIVLETVELPPREAYLNDADLWRSLNDDTIPMWLVGIYMALLALLVLGIEWYVCNRKDPARAWWVAVRMLVGYGMMCIFTAAVTTFLKVYVAEPRPDYLTRCFGSSNVPPLQYTTEMINSNAYCSPDADASLLKDGRQSWPSGHSSSALASAVFFLGFAFWRTRQFSSLGKQLIWVAASIPIMLSLLIGASRIVDNRHSTADVASGFLVGIVCAVIYLIPLLSAVDQDYYSKGQDAKEGPYSHVL